MDIIGGGGGGGNGCLKHCLKVRLEFASNMSRASSLVRSDCCSMIS